MTRKLEIAWVSLYKKRVESKDSYLLPKIFSKYTRIYYLSRKMLYSFS